MPIETRRRKRGLEAHTKPAEFTEAEQAFLDKYYFADYEPLSSKITTPPATGFRVRKVLRQRYLSTHFWSSLRRVPRTAEVPTSDVVYVSADRLHALQAAMHDKPRHSPHSPIELAYAVLQEARVPLTIDDILRTARTLGIRHETDRAKLRLSAGIGASLKAAAAGCPFAKIGHCVYLRHRELEMYTNMLITPRFQALGMTLWEGRYKYVPSEFEHRFLSYRTSTIGEAAGLGVFVRDDVRIPRGTILCEYTGVETHAAAKRKDRDPNAPAAEKKLFSYSVTAGSGTKHEKVIHGKDKNGNVLCFAALINDAGPANANSLYAELDHAPGRVFVITKRSIEPGEEVFITYGTTYWNIDEYPTNKEYSSLSDWSRLTAQCPAAHPPGEIILDECLFCKRPNIPLRVVPLHATHECVDIDQVSRGDATDVDSLPRTMFTSVGVSDGHSAAQMAALATVLVDRDDPLTLGFTHEALKEADVPLAGTIGKESEEGKAAAVQSDQNIETGKEIDSGVAGVINKGVQWVLGLWQSGPSEKTDTEVEGQ